MIDHQGSSTIMNTAVCSGVYDVLNHQRSMTVSNKIRKSSKCYDTRKWKAVVDRRFTDRGCDCGLLILASSNFAMNEIPTRLARHPRVIEDPEVALRETFEEVDRALPEAAVADEQVYRCVSCFV